MKEIQLQKISGSFGVVHCANCNTTHDVYAMIAGIKTTPICADCLSSLYTTIGRVIFSGASE